MKHIKLFENFNNSKVQYIVKNINNRYRIFALTPKMMSDGLGYDDAQDAEQLFGKGSLWVDYPSYESAMDAVNSLNSDEPEEGDYHNESKVNEEFETDDISQSLSDWWIPCEEQLPEDRQLIITYSPKSQMSKINICTFEKGISKTEREELKLSGDERHLRYSGADEDGNNRRPYRWKVQGPGSYFGQDVTHWMSIPDSPDSDYRV